MQIMVKQSESRLYFKYGLHDSKDSNAYFYQKLDVNGMQKTLNNQDASVP